MINLKSLFIALVVLFGFSTVSAQKVIRSSGGVIWFIDSATADTVKIDVTGGTFRITNVEAVFQITSMTTIERDALTPSNGMLINNTTVNQTQSRENGAWVHLGAGAGGGISNIIEDLSPQLGAQLDINLFSFGDGTLELLSFIETVSAVNELTITNAATAGSPSLTATGDDLNIDLTLDGKGTGTVKTLSSNLDVTGNIIVSGTVDGKDIDANAAMLNEAETIASNWINTANPWADNEVSNTLTSSIFVGSGSTTNAIDLATAEVAGILADANIPDHTGEVTGGTGLTIDRTIAFNWIGAHTWARAGLSFDFQNTIDASSNQLGIFRGGNRAIPVDNDSTFISYHADTDLPGLQEFARFTYRALDVTNTTKDADLFWSVMAANALTRIFTIKGAGVDVIGALDITGALTLGTVLAVAEGGTGTGTAFTPGSVVFAGASGVYNQDNTNLFWDDTSNRLGIGTDTPLAKLHIEEPSTADLLRVRQALSTKLIVLNNGDVGIGTSQPDKRFHVAKAIDGSTTLVLIENSQANTVASVNETAEVRFGFGGNNDVTRIVVGKEQDYTSAANEDSFLAFYTDLNGTAAERMRITSSGNVGIGTSSPDANLEIEDITASVTVSIIANELSQSIIDMGDQNDKNVQKIVSDHTSDYMAIFTNNAERMRILSDGKVGIGTVDPKLLLHINAGTNDGIRLGSEINILRRSDGASHLLIQSTIGNSILSVAPFGSASLSAFEFFGTDFVSDPINFERLNFHAKAGQPNKIFSGKGGTGIKQDISIYADIAGQLYLKTDGNIGMGTTSPNTKLEVNGAITQETFVIRKHVALSGATDATATNWFTITTTNETGSADGGSYSVSVHLVANEAGAASGAVNTASVSLNVNWTRIMASAGTGANSAIIEVGESASANEGTGVISAVTVTVTETSEFVQQVLLDVNTSGGTFDGFGLVELVYSDFTTPPVIN